MPNENWEIVIVGAGLVGTSLACLIAPHAKQFNFKVSLVDPRSFDTEKNIVPASDARSLALAYGTQQIYETLGLWSQLKDQAVPIKKVHISDRGHLGLTKLSLPFESITTLGYVISNNLIGGVLGKRINQLMEQKELSLISPGTVTHLTPTSLGMKVTLSSNNRHISKNAHLVIVADGTQSALIKHLGIVQKTHTYDEQAIVANVTSSHPSFDTAYKRFTPQGDIALLPPISNYHPLIWTAPTYIANELFAMSSKKFLDTLQQHFSYRLGRFTSIGVKHKYPITSVIAKEQVRPGVIILGNAAHTLHPVAAQGYNLSIRDSLVLANTILGALKKNQSPGSITIFLIIFLPD